MWLTRISEVRMRRLMRMSQWRGRGGLDGRGSAEETVAAVTREELFTFLGSAEEWFQVLEQILELGRERERRENRTQGHLAITHDWMYTSTQTQTLSLYLTDSKGFSICAQVRKTDFTLRSASQVLPSVARWTLRLLVTGGWKKALFFCIRSSRRRRDKVLFSFLLYSCCCFCCICTNACTLIALLKKPVGEEEPAKMCRENTLLRRELCSALLCFAFLCTTASNETAPLTVHCS